MSAPTRLARIHLARLLVRTAASLAPTAMRARSAGAGVRAAPAALSAAVAPRRFATFARAALAAGVVSRASGGGGVSDMKSLADSFANGSNAGYLDQVYLTWRADPTAVPAEWAAYFAKIDAGVPSSSAFQAAAARASAAGIEAPAMHADTVKVMLLIRAYEVRGHVHAKLDPLGLDVPEAVPELQLSYYGLPESMLFNPARLGEYGKFLGDKELTIGEIAAKLNKIYCRTIGYEYMHIQSRAECNFIRERIQRRHDYFWLDKSAKIQLLDRLVWSDGFEAFLARKFGVEKRFGLEGGEALIPGLKELIDCSSDFGVTTVVMGMPHRGRLSVLANVLQKPMDRIFREFAGVFHPSEEKVGSGDVKYHLGASYVREARSGKQIHITLLANPSHLEAVNPVVLGKARAKQHSLEKEVAAAAGASSEPGAIATAARTKVMPVLLHGDAAFAGQGIVYEGLHLSELPNYTVGGTVHVIVNNQVGFTTDPKDGRSSRYCTDVAKTLGVPVLHCNGDDPEAVVKCMRFAAMWRNTFHRDIVIDIVCYRRSGHNEVDEPSFTQPLMYSKIRSHPSTLKLYTERLVSKGVLTAVEAAAMGDHANKIMEEQFEGQVSPAKTTPISRSAALHRNPEWAELVSSDRVAKVMDTNVPAETLREIGATLTAPPPEGFALHRTLARVLATKKSMFDGAGAVDWGTAEALAIGSLLLEGTHVRLSGQDVQRGTFSHRHAVWHCQKTNAMYTPLNNLARRRERFTISNSPLDEFAVLGFEYGYSLDSPRNLVLWEAQFGDFSNGAQVMIDQFISSGEQKWGAAQSSVTLLLPHGYDGQGPEHSSARLERFLQMSDQEFDSLPREETLIQDHAWQVCNITTPANYFHALRRQIHRQFRKPLVVMSPKALLRDPRAASTLAEFTDVRQFQQLIGDSTPELAARKADTARVILCSGQVYFDLVDERKKRGAAVPIIRIEQLAPLPSNKLVAELAPYRNAQIVWVQEEAKNHGAYTYMLPHLRTILEAAGLKNQRVLYAGRPVASAPATGMKAIHKAQRYEMLRAAFE